jgi:hypothetical protein
MAPETKAGDTAALRETHGGRAQQPRLLRLLQPKPGSSVLSGFSRLPCVKSKT